jgi:hypothetical protein
MTGASVLEQAVCWDEYRKFLKDNEQATKKLMGW